MTFGQKISSERKLKQVAIIDHFNAKYVFHLGWASTDAWWNTTALEYSIYHDKKEKEEKEEDLNSYWDQLSAITTLG